VTVQLIEADADRHLWAERYDRELADIFAIQDELTGTIVTILAGRVEAAVDARAKRKPPENLAAYEYLLAAKRLHHRSEREANAEALRLVDRALALDPRYAHAHAWRGCIIGQSWVYGWCADADAAIAEVARQMQTALALDDNDSDVHRILAAVNLLRRNHALALYHQERALNLNSNDDLIVVQHGEMLTWIGRAEEGIEWIRRAMRLNPYHPERFWSHLGRAYFTARRYAEAIEAYGRIATPDAAQRAFLAACHARLGDETGARRHAESVLKLAPEFSVRRHLGTLHYRDEADRDHLRGALLAASLPP
jgi:adenylate cyclase